MAVPLGSDAGMTNPVIPAILELTDPRWAGFVAGHPGATPFHHPDWARLVAACYGFRAFAVVTTGTAGQIQAGLPVIEVRHLRGEPKWASLPFTDYCPPLVTTPQQEADLACALQHASQAAGVRRVVVRAPLKGAVSACVTGFRHGIPIDEDPNGSSRLSPARPAPISGRRNGGE